MQILNKSTLSDEKVSEFWSNVVIKNKDDCWIYKGDYEKYPLFYDGRKSWRGNRLSLFIYTGEEPSNKLSCHTCDNKKCVNPFHLYWGFIDENNFDTANRPKSIKHYSDTCRRGHDVDQWMKPNSQNIMTCTLCSKLRYIANSLSLDKNLKPKTLMFIREQGYTIDSLLKTFEKSRPHQGVLNSESTSLNQVSIEYGVINRQGKILMTTFLKESADRYSSNVTYSSVIQRKVQYSHWESI